MRVAVVSSAREASSSTDVWSIHWRSSMARRRGRRSCWARTTRRIASNVPALMAAGDRSLNSLPPLTRAEQIREIGDRPGGGLPPAPEGGKHFGVDRLDRVRLLDATDSLEYLDRREVRYVRRPRRAAPFASDDAFPPDGLLEFVQEPRLSDAGLPHERHDLTVAQHRAIEQTLKHVDFGMAPDEGHRVQAARRGPGPEEPVAAGPRLRGARDVEVSHQESGRRICHPDLACDDRLQLIQDGRGPAGGVLLDDRSTTDARQRDAVDMDGERHRDLRRQIAVPLLARDLLGEGERSRSRSAGRVLGRLVSEDCDN